MICVWHEKDGLHYFDLGEPPSSLLCATTSPILVTFLLGFPSLAKLHLIILMLGWVFSLDQDDWLGRQCVFLSQEVVKVKDIIY